ncbi:MAG: AAA family ATPase [Hymenobacter sp.]
MAKRSLPSCWRARWTCRFSRIQFTPDLMPADVLGTSHLPASAPASYEFRRGPIFASVVLIDEINRAPAKTQSALLEVMEERSVTQDGTTYPADAALSWCWPRKTPSSRKAPTALPEAQLDRFLFRLTRGLPHPGEEIQILRGHHSGFGGTPLSRVQPVLTADDLAALRQQVGQQRVEANVLEYIAEIVGGARAHKALYLGARRPAPALPCSTARKALAASWPRFYRR